MGIPGRARAERLRAMDPPLCFVSLGMFIIDTIITREGEELRDVIGGAGTFAAVGARMFQAAGERVGFVVDYGSDCPHAIERTVEGFDFDLLVRRDNLRLCTRGLNTYDEAGTRQFSYLTPKRRIALDSLPPRFLAARSFHLICSPQRCGALVDELEVLRQAVRAAESTDPPVTVWEPVPDLCTPENLQAFLDVAGRVSLVSPNVDECAALFSRSMETTAPHEAEEQHFHARVEEMARRVRAAVGESSTTVIVIRCAAEGAYVDAPELRAWYPAYFDRFEDVVDATGAGNAFCGALAVALAQAAGIDVAMRRATVAAALTIRQVGVPLLSGVQDTSATGWDPSVLEGMLETYRRRCP